jgi:hypothetical protein
MMKVTNGTMLLTMLLPAFGRVLMKVLMVRYFAPTTILKVAIVSPQMLLIIPVDVALNW